jgi:hypothetical protein
MAEGARKRVVLVGHCGPDGYALRSAVARFAPEAEVVFVRDEAELAQELGKADLLLINRELDGDFSEPSGIVLVEELHSENPQRPRLMLVSNFAEAQREAEAVGALPGFGKREMNAEATRGKLRGALGLT